MPACVEDVNIEGGTGQEALDEGVTQLLPRVRSEFLEMPGLRLNRDQTARLCGLDRETSARVLERLVGAGFLFKSDTGWYRRTTAV